MNHIGKIPQTNKRSSQTNHPYINQNKLPKSISLLTMLALIFTFIFPLIGLIFGIISLNQIQKDPSLPGKKIAIVAIILSSILLILSLLFVIILLTVFNP